MAKLPTVPQEESVDGSADFRFKINAFTPATIPMARLGEYMTALAQLLGEADAVHFDKLTTGSTCVNLHIDSPAVPKVWARTESLRAGTASPEVIGHFRAINKMLRDDRGIAQFSRSRARTKVLSFPGIEEAPTKALTLKQVGTFQGQLVRVGGADATAHLQIIAGDNKESKFVADRKTAKRLATHIYDQIRVFGRGTWRRDDKGDWELLEFKVESFEVLNEAKLSEAVADLRKLAQLWPDDILDQLLIDRHGEGEVSDGPV